MLTEAESTFVAGAGEFVSLILQDGLQEFEPVLQKHGLLRALSFAYKRSDDQCADVPSKGRLLDVLVRIQCTPSPDPQRLASLAAASMIKAGLLPALAQMLLDTDCLLLHADPPAAAIAALQALEPLPAILQLFACLPLMNITGFAVADEMDHAFDYHPEWIRRWSKRSRTCSQRW